MKDLINTSNELIFKTIIYCLTFPICYGNIEEKSQDVTEDGIAKKIRELVKGCASQISPMCLQFTSTICA